MEHYYFNKNIDDKGNHEVHTKGCEHMPQIQNQVYIGYCSDCHEAIAKAKKEHGKNNFDGCKYCCEPCHKG